MKTTFIGHQTWLIETDKCKVIIDPLICEQFGLTDELRLDIYPPRKVDSDYLQDLDLIFLSHEHADHFDIESLNLLPRTAKFVIGSNIISPVKKCIKDLGFEIIEVLDQEILTIKDIKLTFYRADHTTAFWESRVNQILVEDLESKETVFIAVDALISKSFKQKLLDGMRTPDVVIVSNNSRTSPVGAYQSLENWAKYNDFDAKKVGPAGVGVLASVITGYLPDFPVSPKNMVLCGGGFIKKIDEFGIFPFAEQKRLGELASKLSLDIQVYGFIPGEGFYLNEHKEIQRYKSNWVYYKEEKHKQILRQLDEFLKHKKSINAVSSIRKDYDDEDEYYKDLIKAEVELESIIRPLMLFPTGKSSIRLSEYRGKKLSQNRIIFVFRSESLNLITAYALNVIDAKFEKIEYINEEECYKNYPFGVDIPLVDFVGMIEGDHQIWDIVGASIRSWFVGGIFDGIVPFFYCYYGENGSPHLLEKVINRKLTVMGVR